MNILTKKYFHTSKTVSTAYSEYKAPLKHSLKGAVAINIEMHNVYQGGLGNTKAELSIYIERDAGAAFESTTPPLAIQADPLRRWL